MKATIPQLGERLPELLEFVRTLARQIESGQLSGSDALARRFREFYTPARMQAIEAVAPGWQAMAAAADGATLHHITQALIALQLLPEYREAKDPLRAVLEWIVLYHDVGKQVIAGQRDALHAFRSATMAARALPHVGFGTTTDYPTTIGPWTQRVLAAAVDSPDGKGRIQDNGALPDILQGLDRLFGPDSAAALVVQGILLHQSLNVVPEWPNPGSLTDAEVATCIRPALVPMLEAMMLVDSDAWQLFDPVSKAKYRSSTLAVFADVRRRVGAASH
jgi:hypothetical protein